ncbi:APC family permease [Streptomyces sp. INA 01156]
MPSSLCSPSATWLWCDECRGGAFYAYISAGLGKRVGLGAGALTLTFYQLSSMGFYIFGGWAMSSLVSSNLGLDLPWWVYVATLMLIVACCSYRGIDFNVRVLAFVVALEIFIIALFNVVTLFRGGPTGRPTEPFTWDAFTSGSIAVAALFATAFFVGFESTAIYREEVRNPARTIPRATYSVIGVISVFYCVTAYCLITALGTGKAVSSTAADPAGAFSAAASAMLGHTFSQVVAVMVVTSVLAAELAMVNAMTRYVYSFGIDRVLPRALGTVHKRHGSPHRAALAANAVTATGILAVVLAAGRRDDLRHLQRCHGFRVRIAHAAGVVGSNRLLPAQPWNRRTDVERPHRPRTQHPLLRMAAVLQRRTLRPSPGHSHTPDPAAVHPAGGAFVVGIGFASWLAHRKPDVFARIGRAEA